MSCVLCMGPQLWSEDSDHFSFHDVWFLLSRSIVRDFLRPHGLQHARPSHLSPSPRACSNSCPLSWWCHPTISSPVILFSCPQSFSVSGSFPMSQLFTSGGQTIGVSASESVLPKSIQGCYLLGLTSLIFLSTRDSQESSSAPYHSSKASILLHSAFFMVQFSYPYMNTRKTIVLAIWTVLSKVMPLLFNTLPRFVKAFLPRSKGLLISWWQSLFTVILQPKGKKKISHCFHCFTIYLQWNDGTRCHDLHFFWMLSFKPTFSLSSFTFIKRFLSSSSLSATRVA